MKKLFSICILLSTIAFYAQTPKTGIISGKVIDSSTKETLPYVNIIIKNNNSEIITGGITNNKGFFEITDIPSGENSVEIQFIGYKTNSRKITFSRENSKHNIGTIALMEDADVLDEVVVIAEVSTIIQKIDRKVINIGKDLTSAGTTAAELLNNVQSVSVDSQTGAISLRGNENVRVLIDGKPSNISVAQLLKQIPSTSIKQIELITNPSAKYSPEGMSGMINIVLHKNSNQGFNGSINTGLTQGENTKFNGSLNMNYKTGKVNFFANYGYNTGKNHNSGQITRSSTTPILQEFDMNNKNNSHLLKIGADIYINKKNTISLYTTQNINDGITDSTTKVSTNNSLTSDALNNISSENKSETYNINYKVDFDEKGNHNLELEATYSNSDAPEDAIYYELINTSDPITNYSNHIKNDRNTSLFNLDYTKPIGKEGKLEIGAEIRKSKTSNKNSSTQHDYLYDQNIIIIGTEAIGNTAFDYNRNIYSGYINYGHTFGNVTMQLGTRFEQYNVEATFKRGIKILPYTQEIFNVYPSAFLTFTPSEKNQFQVSYSRRVDRPSIKQVNPIREWSTPLITSIGNPELKPQFTNSIELNYTRQLNKGSITFGTFFRKINDNISRQSTKDPLNATKQILSYTNFDTTERYGLELSSTYKITKWWKVNASLDYYSKTEQDANKEIRANTLNARISNSFKATKDLRFQLFAMYRGPEDGLQFNRSAMWMLNSGASLNVLKGKGTISFRVNDIFKGMKFKFNSEEPYTQQGEFNWESRTAYLGFTYRFGGGKNKARARKKRDTNESKSGGFI